jgi:REP element-mobilizing transposase RayT
MQKVVQLEPGKFYHIYNCGINGEDLFKSSLDFMHFLKLYERFIQPVCETYSWVLMKNHFHLFVKIKDNVIYKYSNDDGYYDKERFNEIKWETLDLLNADGSIRGRMPSGLRSGIHLSASEGPDSVIKIFPQVHLHFSHLFNAYAKYYNIKYHRHGSLFERQFKRKEVDNKRYFRSLVIYIHQNPIHHGFCEHPMDYGWSSYLTCISVRPTKLNRQEVMGWFDDTGNFKYYHEKRLQVENIEEWLGL